MLLEKECQAEPDWMVSHQCSERCQDLGCCCSQIAGLQQDIAFQRIENPIFMQYLDLHQF